MRRPSLLFWLCAAALLIGAVVVRWDSASVYAGDRVLLNDPDTLRRLVRLEAIDASETYPVVERFDGWPEGTISHWTLPMDWCIRVLDPLVGWMVAGERGYEGGAAMAGPLLAILGLLVMLLLARRLLGEPIALIAGLFYAFSYSTVNVSWFGNGDHQNLQHLCLLGSVLSLLLVVQERRADWLAVLSGALLGLAIWISTESMLVLYVACAAWFAQAAAFPEDEGRVVANARLRWVVGLAAVVLLGHLLEHDSFLAFEDDKVSWWQLYQVVVFGVFAVLARWLPLAGRKLPLAAATAALACGLLPLAVSGELRGAIAERIDAFAKVNVWLQNEVVEFRSIFVDHDQSISLRPALERDSWLLLAFPFLLVAVAFVSRLRRETKLVLMLFAASTFGLEIWEVKLGHVFQITYPLVLVAGVFGVRERWIGDVASDLRWLGVGATAIVVGLAAFFSLPLKSSQTFMPATWDWWLRMTSRVASLAEGKPKAAVLASWDIAPFLMYYAKLPVVGSNYHRNIDGIHDTYRVFLDDSPGFARAREILRERRVGWVVASYNWPFLATGARVIGREPLAEREGFNWIAKPGARETYYWAMRYQKDPPGLRQLFTSENVKIPGRPQEEPLFKIFGVK